MDLPKLQNMLLPPLLSSISLPQKYKQLGKVIIKTVDSINAEYEPYERYVLSIFQQLETTALNEFSGQL